MQRIGSILVVIAWLVFLASLALPAVQFHDSEPLVGWYAGWMAIRLIPGFYRDWSSLLVAMTGVGNVIIVLMPLALFISSGRVHKLLASFFFVVFLIASAFYFDSTGYAAGYYLWVASFLCASIGFGILSGVSPHNKRLQGDTAPPRS